MQPIFAIFLAVGAMAANAEKTHLVVVMAPSEPYAMRQMIDGHINTERLSVGEVYEGFSFDLLKTLSKEAKFKYEIKMVDNYGTYQESHQNWTGLVGELTEGSADLAIADLTVTAERDKAIDFSIPFMSGGITILSKRPVYKEKYLSFLDPFTLGVWIMIAAAYLILGIVFVVLKTIQKKKENISVFSLPILKITVTILTIFLACIYSANLSHFLKSEPPERQILGVEDLVNQNIVKFGAVEGGSTMRFFRESEEDVYQRVWSIMSSNTDTNVKSNKEGIQKVRDGNGKYVFFMESPSAEYATERKCDLETVGGLINKFQYAIGMPLNSEYRKPINQAILRLQESGTIKRIEKKWFEWGACIEGGTQQGCYGPIDLRNIAGIFWMLLTAAIVLVLAIGLEACILK